MSSINVKVNNADLAKTLNVALGSVVKVPTKNGVPINKEWRNRLKPSQSKKSAL